MTINIGVKLSDMTSPFYKVAALMLKAMETFSKDTFTVPNFLDMAAIFVQKKANMKADGKPIKKMAEVQKNGLMGPNTLESGKTTNRTALALMISRTELDMWESGKKTIGTALALCITRIKANTWESGKTTKGTALALCITRQELNMWDHGKAMKGTALALLFTRLEPNTWESGKTTICTALALLISQAEVNMWDHGNHRRILPKVDR